MTPADVLRALTERVVLSWPFHQGVYPELADLRTEEERQRFSFKHIAWHMVKAFGAIATHAEGTDHARPLNIVELRTVLAKMLGNTLRMAAVLDISIEDLLATYEAEYKNSPP